MNLTSITLSPDAEVTLREFMQQRGLTSPDSAVALALRESVARTDDCRAAFDFRVLIGMATGENQNPLPRFQGDDALWEDDRV